jgi:hypothetical protein
MTPGTGASEAPTEPTGWLARTPLWARIAVPVLLAVVIVATIMVVVASAARPDDPVEVATALCREAALDELDSLGREEGDVTADLEVTEAGGDYRVEGAVTYVGEDGASRTDLLRCVVRDVDGELQVRSVRFAF